MPAHDNGLLQAAFHAVSAHGELPLRCAVRVDTLPSKAHTGSGRGDGVEQRSTLKTMTVSEA